MQALYPTRDVAVKKAKEIVERWRVENKGQITSPIIQGVPEVYSAKTAVCEFQVAIFLVDPCSICGETHWYLEIKVEHADG